VTSNDDGYDPDRAAPDVSPPNPAVTAESRIGDGMAALDSLDSRPLAEHAPVYEALHEDLQAVLAEIDGA
jgi:hypothetical protein